MTDNLTSTQLTDFDADTETSHDRPQPHPTAAACPLPIECDALDDEMAQLVCQLSADEIQTLVDTLDEYDTVLERVADVTTDPDLEADIEALSQFSTPSPDAVRAAADRVATRLGIRPFELRFTDPQSDYQDPMIDCTVDTEPILCSDPALNADCIAYATRIHAETTQGQYRLADEWRDALGDSRLAELKHQYHPDAFGFALPEHVPATGEASTRTPITAIPYIGPKTAREIHPTGDLLSFTDLTELTDRQRLLLNTHVDASNLDSTRLHGLVKGILNQNPAAVEPCLAALAGLSDHRHRDDPFEWINSSKTLALCRDLSDPAVNPVAPVTDITRHDTAVTLSSSAGTTTLSAARWDIITTAADVRSTTLHCGDDVPVQCPLPDDTTLVIPPSKHPDR